MYFNWYEFYEKDVIKDLFSKDLNTDCKIFKISIMSEIESFDVNLLEHSNRLSNNLANTYNAEIELNQNPNYFPNIEKQEEEKYQLIDGELYHNLQNDDEQELVVQQISVMKNETPISTIMTVCLTDETPNLTVH